MFPNSESLKFSFSYQGVNVAFGAHPAVGEHFDVEWAGHAATSGSGFFPCISLNDFQSGGVFCFE